MKQTLLLITFLFVMVLNGFSQSKKNDLKLTIAALPLFGSSEGFESGINGITIKPSIGYYISDKTSIEINFAYTYLNELTVGNVDSHYDSYTLMPTLRNNFLNQQKIRLFAEFGFGLGTIKYSADKDRFTNIQHENLSGGISILNIGIGGSYYFNDAFGLEIIIPYIRVSNITSNHFSQMYSGIGPTIGLTYKLN